MYGRPSRPFLFWLHILVPVAGLVCLALGFIARLICRFFFQWKFQLFLALAVVGIRVYAFFLGLFLFLLLDEEVEPTASGQTDQSHNPQELAGKAGDIKVFFLGFGLRFSFLGCLFGFFLGLLLFQLRLNCRLLFGIVGMRMKSEFSKMFSTSREDSRSLTFCVIPVGAPPHFLNCFQISML